MTSLAHENWEDDEPPMLGEVDEQGEGNQAADEAVTPEDASIMDEMVAVAQRAKESKRKLQDRERNRKSFGQGLKKGFFNTTKPTKTKKATTEKSASILEPAQQRSLGASEEAMVTQSSTTKQPVTRDIHEDNNQASSNSSKAPGIVDLDEARRQAIAGMKRSPAEEEQVQRILNNPELLAVLSDEKLMQRLHACQQSPGELRRLAQDPVLGPKLRLLVQHNMVQFAS
ncbi:unnamed protein product [Phytophthora fragariaefolia]|uniref:Unnamed protein product n=1 Tax=Phytophthora fragariaefolia TaxID=1490495 RepID=A0A9W6Y4X7_9STRA|nr:unnamed protein product [Phytophthora fragariaefolia]